MELVKNDEGVTLVEVLAAMAILSIILISLLNFFPQMSMVNKYNEDKAQAINSAKELLLEWQEKSEIKNYIDDPSILSTLSIDPPQITDNYYIFETTHDNFDAIVKINKIPSKASEFSNAHLMVVQLFDQKNNLIGEIYGYMVI